jgi:hypothetical protein
MESAVIFDNPKFGLLKVRAWGAAPYIRSALLQRADIHVSFEGPVPAPRTLSHGAEHRPASPLTAIWPLSILAAHDVVYLEYRDAAKDYVTTVQKYPKGQIMLAVGRFLEGLPDDSEISINVWRDRPGF